MKDKLEAAQNPASPPETLITLSRDEDAYVRSGVAQNPACPPETLLALSRDEDAWVRYGVAQNPACPPGVKAVL